MLKIRLQRTGRKNNPAFRVVLTDSKNSTKSGRFHEILGTYNLVTDEKRIDAERVKYWISKGAQPSGTVHNYLVNERIIPGKKINVLPKHRPVKKDQPQTTDNQPQKKEEKIEQVAPAETPAQATE